MKTKLVILIIVLLITGCGNKKDNYNLDVDFDQEQYQIYTPYKKGVVDNYVVNNVLNNYDLSNIEDSLIALSSNYFRYNNSYYQEGQYLNYDDLKLLLSKDYLNKTDKVTIDGIELEPIYINSIIEQNFLANNGNLKGITFGIILNPYKSYKNSYGTYVYKKVDENTVLEHGRKMSQELLKYIYKEKKLESTRIVIGLYLQPSPNSVERGLFKEVGVTTKTTIKFEPLEYQYALLKSNYVIENDINTYNSFINFENYVNSKINNLYINGEALYQNKNIKDIKIHIKSSSYSKSQLLYLTQLIGEEIGKYFENNINIRVYIESNDKIEALITKDKNTLKSNVSIIGE